jgi:hypothetical protein
MCWALRIKRKFAFDICKRTELIQWQDRHTLYRTELYLDGFWDLCNKLFKLSTECKSCKQVSVVGQVSARDITSVKRQPHRAADFGATLPTREGNLWDEVQSEAHMYIWSLTSPQIQSYISHLLRVGAKVGYLPSSPSFDLTGHTSRVYSVCAVHNTVHQDAII